MKVFCASCGYELEMDDKLLIEGSLDFSCPNCQKAIKVPQKAMDSSSGKKESQDLMKTEVLSNKPLSRAGDEPLIPGGEDEVTLNRIADEMSSPGKSSWGPEISISTLISDIKDRRDISGISLSKVPKGKTKEAADKTHAKPKFDKGDTVVSERQGYEESQAEDSSPQLYDTKSYLRGRSSKIPLSQSGYPESEAKVKKSLLIYIPLLCLALLIVAYPLISLRVKEHLLKPKTQTEPLKIKNILSKASSYIAFDSSDSLLQAEKILLKATATYPDNLKLKAMLSRAYAELGLRNASDNYLHKSLMLATDVLSSDPNDLTANRAMAVYYIQNPEKSLTYLRKILSIMEQKDIKGPDPDDLLTEASVETALGKFERAKASLKKALDIAPDYLKAHRFLYQLHLLTSDTKSAKTEAAKIDSLEKRFLAKAPELKSKSIHGTISMRTAQPKSPATPEAQASSQSSPDEDDSKKQLPWDARHAKGMDFASKAKFFEAEKELLGAIDAYKEHFPHHSKSKVLSNIYNSLGQTYVKLYRADSALNAFKNSLKYNFGNAEAHKALANLYEELGENRQAINEYKHYLRYNPSANDASQVKERIKRLKQ